MTDIPKAAALANALGIAPPRPHLDRFRASAAETEVEGQNCLSQLFSVELTQCLAAGNFQRNSSARKVVVIEK